MGSVGYVGDRYETVNVVISKQSKLAQNEYKARYDWVEKVIHWELCKRLKFDHTNKCYMNKTQSVLENKTHKILWNFAIQLNSYKVTIPNVSPYTIDSPPIDIAIETMKA